MQTRTAPSPPALKDLEKKLDTLQEQVDLLEPRLKGILASLEKLSGELKHENL
jgi:chaperonin cofactor prefoldin